VIILDTNVISELMRVEAAPKVKQWLLNCPERELFTTAITEAEIFFGIELLPTGKKRNQLAEAALFTFEDFQGRILAFDSRAAHAFGKIAAERRAKGKSIGETDAQIAAIALSHGARLATRDVSDFQGCGITVVNPWTD
jgi:predicted nucleic acid-binding protein